MTELPDLFPGFDDRMVAGVGGEIHCRIGGDGPPLLLLHGFPQSHAMWHLVAPGLARRFTVIVADLPGYGTSSIPDLARDPAAFSKRAMGAGMVAMMRRLGHDRFRLVGHDRGGRVGYRLALDRPEVLERLAVLDILPTFEYWRRLDRKFGLKIYHWLFLAQPAPLPERLIGADPDFFLDYKFTHWAKHGVKLPFDPRAMEHYRANVRDPARLAAMCEDYRAGAGIDVDHDEADRDAGKRIAVKMLVLWGTGGAAPTGTTPLDTWRDWANDVTGEGIDSGHYLPEENAAATCAALLRFLAG